MLSYQRRALREAGITTPSPESFDLAISYRRNRKTWHPLLQQDLGLLEPFVPILMGCLFDAVDHDGPRLIFTNSSALGMPRITYNPDNLCWLAVDGTCEGRGIDTLWCYVRGTTHANTASEIGAAIQHHLGAGN